MKKYLLPSAAMAVLALGFSSCEKDNKKEEISTYSVPSTYNFDNVDYSGQTARLGMLAEMSSYLKSANASGVTIDEKRALAMYENGPDANFTGNFDASKQLKSKTISTEQGLMSSLIADLSNLSSVTSNAVEGAAGRIKNNAQTKEYLLNDKGIELAQIIEKGLMGACFYYQATSVYFGTSKIDVDNETVEAGKGTKMQHHWDEAFGYFGVPLDFPLNNAGLFFWGKYTNSRDGALACNSKIMNAFIKGRAAIGAKNIVDRDAAISTIRSEWEKVSAASAVHYLNAALASFSTDKGVVHHSLSEAIAFIYSLKFNVEKSASLSDIDAYLNNLAGSSDITKMDLYKTTKENIEGVKANLSNQFGFTAIADTL